MFLGSYEHSVDAKGRAAIPANFRRELSAGAVISIGPEDRLVIWPTDAWAEYTETLRRTTSTPPEQRRFTRLLYGNSRPVDLDGQGRILLSAEHRKHAGIVERAVFVGVGNCVEVVSAERWGEESDALTPQAFTELQDRISTRGAGAPFTGPA